MKREPQDRRIEGITMIPTEFHELLNALHAAPPDTYIPKRDPIRATPTPTLPSLFGQLTDSQRNAVRARFLEQEADRCIQDVMIFFNDRLAFLVRAARDSQRNSGYEIRSVSFPLAAASFKTGAAPRRDVTATNVPSESGSPRDRVIAGDTEGNLANSTCRQLLDQITPPLPTEPPLQEKVPTRGAPPRSAEIRKRARWSQWMSTGVVALFLGLGCWMLVSGSRLVGQPFQPEPVGEDPIKAMDSQWNQVASQLRDDLKRVEEQINANAKEFSTFKTQTGAGFIARTKAADAIEKRLLNLEKPDDFESLKPRILALITESLKSYATTEHVSKEIAKNEPPDYAADIEKIQQKIAKSENRLDEWDRWYKEEGKIYILIDKQWVIFRAKLLRYPDPQNSKGPHH